MEIFFRVRDQVMMAVMRRPPEWSLLIRGGSSERHQKLKEAAGAIGAVRQQAMKPGGDRKHSHHVKPQTYSDCYRAHARPNHQQAGEVHEEELRADKVVQPVVVVVSVLKRVSHGQSGFLLVRASFWSAVTCHRFGQYW